MEDATRLRTWAMQKRAPILKCSTAHVRYLKASGLGLKSVVASDFGEQDFSTAWGCEFNLDFRVGVGSHHMPSCSQEIIVKTTSISPLRKEGWDGTGLGS